MVALRQVCCIISFGCVMAGTGLFTQKTLENIILLDAPDGNQHLQ
jgi:hypothetical protein